MRKLFRFSWLILALIISLSGYSKTVSKEQAMTVAVNWFNSSQLSKFSRENIESVNKIVFKGEVTLYVVNFKPVGWVMVSSSDHTEPILGYSSETCIDFKELPVQFEQWVGLLSEEIIGSFNEGASSMSATTQKWELLSDTSFTPPLLKSTAVTVGPLVSTQWNQGRYFNEMAPSDPTSSTGNGHVWIGCVATSMAQTMKYWAHPVSGLGQHEYNHSSYGLQSANFEQASYNWAEMPIKPTSPNNELAQLSYHCAVSVNMDFGPDGSGAFLPASKEAFYTYFKYNTTLFTSEKARWDEDEWIALMKSDLNRGRPIIYAGYNPSYTVGHAWICDGYNDTHFHFNWGWSGYADGYYLLSALTPGTSNYTNKQEALFGIEPVNPAVVNFPYVESFESGGSGKFSTFGLTEVVSGNANTGSKSIRLGKESFVSVATSSLLLTFIVPEDASLSFWVKRATPLNSTRNTQSATLYPQWGSGKLISFFEGDFNDSGWVGYTADLSAYQGQIVRLQFSQENNDLSRDQWMFVDDIAIAGENMNLAPYRPANPGPADLSENVTLSTLLSWTGGDPNGDKVLYKVYFSENNPPSLVASTNNRFYKPENIKHKTKYFWNIVASDGQLETLSPVWSFSSEGIPPEVETCGVSEITSVSAKICNHLVSLNSTEISERGICWSTADNPTVSNNRVGTSLTGNFTYGNLVGLKPFHNYFVRAYAISDEGCGYGDVLRFTTSSSAPEVLLGTVHKILRTSATINATVTNLNDSVLLARGVEWSLQKGFVPGNGTKVLEYGNWKSISDYQVKLVGLPGPDTIFYRAMAVNTIETSYSDEGFFVLLNSVPDIDLDLNNSSGIDGNRYKGNCREQDPDSKIADSDVVLSDEDGDTIKVVTVEVLNPVHIHAEKLMYYGNDQRIQVQGNATGLLTLTRMGSMDNSDWAQVVRNIGFYLDHDYPNTSIVRQISVKINDGLDFGIPALSYLTVIAVNDAPVNLSPPELRNQVGFNEVAGFKQGIWGDTLDHCTGNMSFQYQWQFRLNDHSEASDIEGANGGSLLISETLCGGEIRIKETVSDSYCGGANHVFGEAFSAWSPIRKNQQTIKLNAIPVVKYSDGFYVVSGEASSGFPLKYGTSLKQVAEVSNDTLYLKGLGKTVVSASQPGNSCFYPSDTRYGVLEVVKGSQEIIAEWPDQLFFHEKKVAINAASTSGLPLSFAFQPDSILKVINDSIVIMSTGSVTITASQVGNDLFEPASPVTKTLVVSKGDQNLSIKEIPVLRMGMSPVLLEVVSTSGLEPIITVSNGSVLKIEGKVLHLIGAGNATIYINQAGNADWNPAKELVIPIVVGKGSPNLSVKLKENIRLSDSIVCPEINLVDDLPFTLGIDDVTVAEYFENCFMLKKAGKAVCKLKTPGNEHYEADSMWFDLNIGKGIQEINFGPFPEVIFSVLEELLLQASATSGLPVNYSSHDDKVALVSGNILKITGAGSTSVAAYQYGNENWEAANPKTQTLTVGKATQTIILQLPDTVTTLSKTIYGKVAASSGLPITITSENSSVALWKDDSIQILAPGEAWFHLVQQGNRNFLPIEGRYKLVVVKPSGKAELNQFSFDLFPNPAKAKVYLSLQGDLSFPVLVHIFNMPGGQVLKVLVNNDLSIINLEPLHPGVYQVQVSTNGIGWIKKLIVR